MPSLRDYRDRIKSVKSTRKITSAMKMVAASKLRRAQEQAEAAQPYARAMAEIMARLAQNTISTAGKNLLTGTGSDKRHLLIVVTADRGLCGGFNANIIREARAKIRALQNEGKEISVVCVGKKAREAMNRTHKSLIAESFADIFSGKLDYAKAHRISDYLLKAFAENKFDVATLLYNEFRSVLTQTPRLQQLIPFQPPVEQDNAPKAKQEEKKASSRFPYDFEPDQEEILNKLLPRNIGVQIFRGLLDSAAGEQAARMTAMDNATRNAGEMIKDLTLQYNRARQAYITKELIEIISGAEAL